MKSTKHNHSNKQVHHEHLMYSAIKGHSEHELIHNTHEQHVQSHMHSNHSHVSADSGSKPSRTNNFVLGIVAMICIAIIVVLAVSSSHRSVDSSDYSGQAISVLSNTDTLASSQKTDIIGAPLCKIIVGQTTIYDSNTIAVTLQQDQFVQYSGVTVSINELNSQGCVVNVNGESEFLAVGQIQKIGSVYVTVREVLQ